MVASRRQRLHVDLAAHAVPTQPESFEAPFPLGSVGVVVYFFIEA